MAEDLHLVWRGVDGDCAGMRLNGGSVLGGSRVRLELEHVGPRSSPLPTTVQTSTVVEPLLAKMITGGRQRMDSLLLHPTVRGSVVAATDTFMVRPPATAKGVVRLLASTDHGRVTAWVDSVDSRGGLRVVNQRPRDYDAKVDVSAFDVEATVELGRTAGSTTTYRQTVVAAVDPLVRVEIIRPGDGDFNQYLGGYLDSKEVWSVAQHLRLELYARYGHHLDPRTRLTIDVRATPSSDYLGAGESMTVDVEIEARTDSARGTFFALRAVNAQTGVACVSDLVRIDRPPGPSPVDEDGELERAVDRTTNRSRQAALGVPVPR